MCASPVQGEVASEGEPEGLSQIESAFGGRSAVQISANIGGKGCVQENHQGFPARSIKQFPISVIIKTQTSEAFAF